MKVNVTVHVDPALQSGVGLTETACEVLEKLVVLESNPTSRNPQANCTRDFTDQV